ncbi:hypothetical protein HYS50_02960 [Candidatus Woesearchaeota archaeon]|nr:hypothetical protein [Candidatus Woesearchaeota archaeon]
MNKRLMLVVVSILLAVVVVFAVAQEQNTDSAVVDSEKTETQEQMLVDMLLSDEQRVALEQRPKDIAQLFTELASRFTGDTNA